MKGVYLKKLSAALRLISMRTIHNFLSFFKYSCRTAVHNLFMSKPEIFHTDFVKYWQYLHQGLDEQKCSIISLVRWKQETSFQLQNMGLTEIKFVCGLVIINSISKNKLTFKESPLCPQILKKKQLLRRYFQSSGRKCRYQDERFPEISCQCCFCSDHCRFRISFL